jgi:hypothetical protein
MTIFICPYRKSNGGEAEAMVKSLDKFAGFPHSVIFVGDDPKIPGTTCINYVSKNKTKESRVSDQLKAAIVEYNLKQFVLINDDIFAIKPFTTIPLYYDGIIKDQLKKYNPANVYRHTLANSIQQPDDLNFALHYPMWIGDTKKFLKALDITIEMKYNSFRNLYGNMVKRKYKDLLTETKDCKLFSKGTPERINDVMKYSGWLSVGDNWWSSAENKKAVFKIIQ